MAQPDNSDERVALHHIPLRLAAPGERKRAEYRAALIGAGYVKMRNGETSALYIPPDVLQASTEMFQNAAVFVDHPQESFWDALYPEVKFLAGVIHSPEWVESEQAIMGTIRLSGRSDNAWLVELLDEIVADQQARQPVPDVGLSAVIFRTGEWREVNSQRIFWLTKIKRVESTDIVFGPGARGRFTEKLNRLNYPSGGYHVSDENKDQKQNTLTDLSQALAATLETPPAPLSQPQAAPPGPLAPVLPTPAPQNEMLALRQDITQLTALVTQLAQAIEPKVITGLGLPHTRQPLTGQTGLERFTPVVSWLFGDKDAPLPDPQFRRADQIYWALTGDYEFRGVFDRERVMLASANTTTLAGLAVNAMNKVIINQFSNLSFWRWYERIVWVAPNDGSLHDMQWITFGGIGNLPTINDGGAYNELTVDDVKEADPWVTKGGYVGITRKMIKNSDIQRIQAVPVALAIACVRTRSAAVSDIFTSNAGVGPTLDQDATALFHANHSNLGTTAFAQAEWRVVRAAIFKHTDVNSAKRLGYFPKYGLFPADLYDAALAVFGYGDGYPTTYTPEAQDRGMGDPRPVPLAVPDWTDTNNWAAIVDPQVYPVIQMSYSQAPGGGVHPPCELFVAMDPNGGLMFSNDTLPIKVRDEFVVGVNGPRGIYKENVA